MKFLSNGGVSYTIGKIIAKDNLNIAMHTFENLLLQKLLNKLIRYYTEIDLGSV